MGPPEAGIGRFKRIPPRYFSCWRSATGTEDLARLWSLRRPGFALGHFRRSRAGVAADGCRLGASAFEREQVGADLRRRYVRSGPDRVAVNVADEAGQGTIVESKRLGSVSRGALGEAKVHNWVDHLLKPPRGLALADKRRRAASRRDHVGRRRRVAAFATDRHARSFVTATHRICDGKAACSGEEAQVMRAL